MPTLPLVPAPECGWLRQSGAVCFLLVQKVTTIPISTPGELPFVGTQVTEQGNGVYFCEYDGSTVHQMERRYVLSAQAADFTGEAYLNLFNDQVSCVALLLPSPKQLKCCRCRAAPTKLNAGDWQVNRPCCDQQAAGRQFARWPALFSAADAAKREKKTTSIVAC